MTAFLTMCIITLLAFTSSPLAPSSSSTTFSLLSPLFVSGAPTITSIEPRWILPGQNVTIRGVGFTPQMKLYMNYINIFPDPQQQYDSIAFPLGSLSSTPYSMDTDTLYYYRPTGQQGYFYYYWFTCGNTGNTTYYYLSSEEVACTFTKSDLYLNRLTSKVIFSMGIINETQNRLDYPAVSSQHDLIARKLGVFVGDISPVQHSLGVGYYGQRHNMTG